MNHGYKYRATYDGACETLITVRITKDGNNNNNKSSTSSNNKNNTIDYMIVQLALDWPPPLLAAAATAI